MQLRNVTVGRWRMYAIGFCSAVCMAPSQVASSGEGIKGGVSSKERWRENSPSVMYCINTYRILSIMSSMWSARIS